jgi:hypothetical protein
LHTVGLVGLTGVIYAAIVVAWAIYLVPLALRRHDQTARNRSIERFSSSMRVLSTGERGTADSRVVVTPPRAADRVVGPEPAVPTVTDGASAAVRPVSRKALREAAARRRRVLCVLVALTFITGAVSVLGVIPAWSFAVPIAVIVVFLAVARRQVRLANELYWRRAADARAASSNVVRRAAAARIDATHGAARESQKRRAPVSSGGDGSPVADDQDPDDEPTITLSAEQLAAARRGLTEDHVVAVPLQTSDGSSLWDPLPITLPAYVDKPVAKRSVRKISIGEASTWSSGHSAAASVNAGSSAAPQTPPDGGKAKNEGGSGNLTQDGDGMALSEPPRAANA